MHRVGVLLSLLFLTLAPAHAAEPPAQRFVVFFQEWSARLDGAAQEVITRAAEVAKAHRRNPVHVNAFADPTGSRKANQLLSDLRAQMVMDQLQADGVAPARIIGRGHGPVKFVLTSQESRRVEISIGGR